MERYFTRQSGPREEVFFGFDWEFALTDSTDFPNEQAQWRKVQLPHDWSVEEPLDECAPSGGSGGYVRTGIGWYRKRFSFSPIHGERCVLRFDGAYMHCDVYLNGARVGGHVYGYTSFELEITNALCDGENVLYVRVDNSHQPNSRWYSGSGITRDVYLVRTQEVYLRTGGIFITTPRIEEGEALVSVNADVMGGAQRDDLLLSADILSPDGTVCASCEGKKPMPVECARVDLAIKVPAPLRWDIERPQLYTAVLRLYGDDEQGDNMLLDEVRVRFGIREIAFNAENGFLLNGRKVIMQGACLHHDGGCVGAAVPPAVWRRRLEKLREMGCNALRMSHNPPDPALLDLADELGFVVMDEAFDEWHRMKGKEFGSNTHSSRGYSEWFDSCAREDLTAMVERDRNHPCVVIWSIGNEVPEQAMRDGHLIARELAGLCHSLDPTRPITQACDQLKAEPWRATDAFLDQLDIVGVNYADRWRERTETFFDEEKREHPNWLLLGTEDVSVGGKRGEYDVEQPVGVWGPGAYHARMLKAEKLWKFIRTRPYMIGSFMWTGVDYLGECFWPDKGSSAGVLDTCGFPKDGYWFYKSQWVKDEPVLHIFPHLNSDLAPGTIYPIICYTNCASVELFADGRSYGVKAYEFPNQGMTQQWAHFDRPFVPITTNDLHLSWDIPSGCAEVVAIGRNDKGEDVACVTLTKAGAPHALRVKADRTELRADGRDVMQLDIELVDAKGRIVPDCELPIRVDVVNGELLGMDNGRTDDHAPYRCGERETYMGLAYAIVRAPREPGEMTITVSAPGLESACISASARA